MIRAKIRLYYVSQQKDKIISNRFEIESESIKGLEHIAQEIADHFSKAWEFS